MDPVLFGKLLFALFSLHGMCLCFAHFLGISLSFQDSNGTGWCGIRPPCDCSFSWPGRGDTTVSAALRCRLAQARSTKVARAVLCLVFRYKRRCNSLGNHFSIQADSVSKYAYLVFIYLPAITLDSLPSPGPWIIQGVPGFLATQARPHFRRTKRKVISHGLLHFYY